MFWGKTLGLATNARDCRLQTVLFPAGVLTGIICPPYARLNILLHISTGSYDLHSYQCTKTSFIVKHSCNDCSTSAGDCGSIDRGLGFTMVEIQQVLGSATLQINAIV